MSKIVQAVNSMISNPDNISKVLQTNSEIFFLYRDKYKWSMSRRENDEHILWFYPGQQSIESIAANDGNDWESVDMVTYRDKDIGTKEAHASFADLYMLLKERVFGVNKALDDIISDSEQF